MSKLTDRDVAQFTGSTCYYRIGKQHLLTDGTHYLADRAGCDRIMDAVSSHVVEIGTQDWFVVVFIEDECRFVDGTRQ